MATSRRAILCLALAAALFHSLDLWTGLRMMQVYGPSFELNPVARSLFVQGGSTILALSKVSVVLASVSVLVYLAVLGRSRLARNCLIVAVEIGALGFISNLV